MRTIAAAVMPPVRTAHPTRRRDKFFSVRSRDEIRGNALMAAINTLDCLRLVRRNRRNFAYRKIFSSGFPLINYENILI